MEQEIHRRIDQPGMIYKPGTPKSFWTQKDFWTLVPVYFFVSFIELTLKLQATAGPWFGGQLTNDHRLLWRFQYFNNEQSRLLQWVIPQAICKITEVTIPQAYMIQRFVFVFLAFVCFHLYLRKWLSPGECLAGVTILAALMPFTFLSDLQESAPLLMLLFVLGLWAIREKKTILFGLTLLIGSITNETMLILPLVYFFYQFRSVPLKKINGPYLKEFFTWVRNTLLVSALPFTLAGAIRYITRDRPHLGDGTILWQENWRFIWNAISQIDIFSLYRAHYLFFILLFSVFWLYALLGYRKSGLFLQRALWMVPLFLLMHLITGKISESRQMIPLGFILIPMGLSFIFSKEFNKSDAGAEVFDPKLI
jgi:hypothetical protein